MSFPLLMLSPALRHFLAQSIIRQLHSAEGLQNLCFGSSKVVKPDFALTRRIMFPRARPGQGGKDGMVASGGLMDMAADGISLPLV